MVAAVMGSPLTEKAVGFDRTFRAGTTAKRHFIAGSGAWAWAVLRSLAYRDVVI
jgi:hypothetical protein